MSKIIQAADYHVPALLIQSVDGMNIAQGNICIDTTFGGGGHSREILSRLGKNGKLLAFDQDEDTIANLPDDKRIVFVKSNFRYLKNFVRYHGIEQVDAILADLGVSSHHFDDAGRGFSFRYEDGILDMRMNKNARKTAGGILNNYSEEQLADVFYCYGELTRARQIAAAIVRRRMVKPIGTAGDLLEILDAFCGKGKDKKLLAQVFQALRIEVNDEIDALKELLTQSLDILKPGGRLAIITYHSLEDRLVKNFFKAGNFEGNVEQDFFGNRQTPFRLVNNKVITPSEQEQIENPRSRSAKLRIAEKR
ncbi:MAG: 16S rRNA (cytosine(1402)-N(4))-methyltransferase RsmH [Prevotella sp.]|jgi:16S rRNA (cytosine1402-N4)-methyltransferase|nr:16S rRNA (cytosine(1402)-N(4))-methyltransferase RsmH [Prevotella sp.]